MVYRNSRRIAGVSALTLSAIAHAQDVGTATDSTAAPAIQEIVVTGSRLAISGDSFPTPVTVITPDVLLQTSPSNIPDGLNKLPTFAGSRNTANLNNPSDNFTGNYLNLRGIGIQRNLVLFDGHRVPPTSYTGAVDTNVLPQILLERVDVVTGGASAVYGSDAVSGVINFVLDRSFEGVKATAQSGISDEDDAFSWRAAAAFGTSLMDGSGHFLASFEHFHQDGIDDKFDRPLGRRVYTVAGSGSSADPFRLIQNGRNASVAMAGSIFSGPFAGQIFTPEGGTLESGGDGYYGAGSSLTADLTTDQAFARFSYQLGDNLNAFVQGTYAESSNENNFYPVVIFPHTIAPDNPFLSAAMRAQLTDPFIFARVLEGQQFIVHSETKNWSAATGLDGEIGRFNWSAFYQHGVTTTYNTDQSNWVQGNLIAALDAVDDGRFRTGTPNGNIVCRVTLTNPSAYPGCVPLNPFGTSAASQSAALKYVLGSVYNRPEFELDNVEASISGTAFDNWAGPVQVAFSGQYRRLSLDVATDFPATVHADCTGLRFDCAPGALGYIGTAQITPVSASENVSEVAFEGELPLLKDVALARSLSLNTAVRYTDYSTSGSATTWKVGSDWRMSDSFRLRATRSRDIRAPSLYELYQPASAATSGYQDLHTGFNGITPTETSGNKNLFPEKADTITVGAVFRPENISGLSVTVDYYRIKISDAIASIDGRIASIQKVCEDSNGASQFCSLYVRPLPFSNRSVANAPTLVKLQSLNASEIETWGVDGEVNYSLSAGPGRLSLRGLVGYQPEFTSVLAPGLPSMDAAGVASTQATGGVAKWRLTGFVSYGTDAWSVDLQERWRSSLEWDSNKSLVYAIPDVASVAYTDLTVTGNFGKDRNIQAFVSVQNVFDKDPPVYLTSGTSGTPGFSFPAVSGDDVIGRYYTAGLRFKL
jgi:outer membrane receptor protein involved in Fe transport